MIRKVTIVALTLAATGTSATCIGVRHLVKFQRSPFYGGFYGAISYQVTDEHSLKLVCTKESILSPLLRSSYLDTRAPQFHIAPPWHFSLFGIGGMGRVIKDKSFTYYLQSFDAPLWFVTLIFATYPTVAFIRGPLRRFGRAKRRRYVERRWFAVTAGMVAFAITAFAALHFLIDSIAYRKLERLTGSDAAAMAVALSILVVVTAVSALVTHNVIAGPLRKASLTKPKMCVHCSYNLTGNVSGDCPECGSPVVPNK